MSISVTRVLGGAPRTSRAGRGRKQHRRLSEGSEDCTEYSVRYSAKATRIGCRLGAGRCARLLCRMTSADVGARFPCDEIWRRDLWRLLFPAAQRRPSKLVSGACRRFFGGTSQDGGPQESEVGSRLDGGRAGAAVWQPWPARRWPASLGVLPTGERRPPIVKSSVRW